MVNPYPMKPQITSIRCGILLSLLPLAGFAQTPAIEFANGSGPTTNGSSLANQVITFQDNLLNPTTGTYVPLSSPVTATFAISNQQYILPASQNPNGGDISFGAGNNTTGKLPLPSLLFPTMGSISAPMAAEFSSTPVNIGAGMSMTTNYAVEVYTSVMGLYNANVATNGTYYMADLTITFNVPITNPVLQIVGIGGFSGALGFTTDLTLTTPGLTMTELSGSKELSVTGGGTQIVNTAASPTATTGSGAASGSVLVNGSSVTSLTFQLYVRGDGKTPTWATANEHVGDAWLIGVSAINTMATLPVGMTGFTTQPRGHTVDLQWTTATEQNSKDFVIERSQDGVNWNSIGQVAAAGNSQESLQYNYVDQTPMTGANYYRLQEIAEDGSSVYSEIRSVEFTGTTIAVNWYPNPTHDQVTLTSSSTLQSITLISLDGRILQTAQGFSSGQSVDLSRYPFGIYFLIIRTADGQTQTAKIERN
jgi:type IX secretion system substrate protein